MAYDDMGRWIPSEDINWKRDTEAEKDALRMQLTKSGLDWRHKGKYAFRSDVWSGAEDDKGRQLGHLSEEQRFSVLEQYDTWYDAGHQLALNDEEWGLDIERGITYDTAKTWNTQALFHNLTGGNIVRYTVGKNIVMKREYEKDGKTITEYSSDGKSWNKKSKGLSKGAGGVGIAGDKTGYDWLSLTNPYKYSDKIRGTFLDEGSVGGEVTTTYQVREYPMDWANYTHDELYRAAIDDVIEQDYDMFMGPGSDFDTARQVRAAGAEIQSWVQDVYDKAGRKGIESGWTPEETGKWAEKELEAYQEKQVRAGRISNKRYPEGKNTRGFEHGQQVMIRKYKPFEQFNEETGTRTTHDPITGEVKSTIVHTPPPAPSRMTITGNKLEENVDARHFYSPTYFMEGNITDSLMDEPDPIAKPDITIRKSTAKLPANIKNWKTTASEVSS